MKILLTGASGFVGGALWRRCAALGFEIRALGRRPNAHPDYLSRDLAEPLSLDFVPDVVVHAAARSSPWGSAREFRRQNVIATGRVVDFCVRSGLPHLIYISTSAVLYRNEHQFGLDEEAPVPERFINEYARTKYAGELLTKNYPGPSCILRVRAVFGPGDTVVFPRLLRAAQRQRLPWIESEQPVWSDLIYIETLVDYVVRAIERRSVGLYHLTNNQPVAIQPFLAALFARLGLPMPTRTLSAGSALRLAAALEGAYRALPVLGEPPLTRFGVSALAYSKTFNVARALQDLGPPSVALNEGLERFVAWQKPRLADPNIST